MSTSSSGATAKWLITLDADISKLARQQSQILAQGGSVNSKQIQQGVGNVAWAYAGYISSDSTDLGAKAVDYWLKQNTRKSIEGDYNVTGIGIVQDDQGGYYLVEIFVKKT